MVTGRECMESSSKEQEFGVLLDERLDIAQPRVLAVQKAKYIPGCLEKHEQKVKEGGPPSLLCSWDPTWGPQHKDMDLLEQFQREP